jgi:N5-(cytidine 5'-diphosphoramidyl)-L-glutamine hydrolase
MKLIAVSQRVDVFPERGERRDALDQRLVHWLKAAGFLAAPVPNDLWQDDELVAWLTRIAPCGLLLSGGNDLGESPERDHTEALLLNWAASLQRPVLGICRGMQMLAAHTGSPLQPVVGHVATRHVVLPLTGEQAWPETVNSFHKWGLIDPPQGYVALARGEDGSLEAMRHETLPWEGWMWHPEREADFHPADIERLRQLMAAGIPADQSA